MDEIYLDAFLLNSTIKNLQTFFLTIQAKQKYLKVFCYTTKLKKEFLIINFSLIQLQESSTDT